MSDFEDAKLILTPNAYKAGKAYCVKPFDGSGDFTVVRNTTATTRNSSGNLESVAVNVPRLNYPIGGGCPSWLIEPQSTNLVTHSENFSNASWRKLGSVVTQNNTISPEGVQNASEVTALGTSVLYIIIRDSIVVPSAGTYTMSCFFKYTNNDWVSLVFGSYDSTGVAWFDIQNGVKGQVNGGTSDIEDYGNGWYRCSVTSAIGTGDLDGRFQINVCPDDGGVNYPDISSRSGKSVELFGAQLEQGGLTSYIPTNGSTVTRNTDVLTVAPPSGTTEIVETLEDITYYIGGNNLVTNSEDFTDASWSKSASTITANSIVSPDGTTNADTFNSLNTGSSFIQQTITTAASTRYNTSVFAKKGVNDYIAIVNIEGGNISRIFFDLVNGVVSSTSNTGTPFVEDVLVENYSNGWYRCSFSQLIAGTSLLARIYASDDGINLSAGVVGATHYIWGAQLEQGSTATDYQATRDIVTIPATYQLPNGEIKKVIMK